MKSELSEIQFESDQIQLSLFIFVEKECLDFDHVNQQHNYLNALNAIESILKSAISKEINQIFVISIQFLVSNTKLVSFLNKIRLSHIDLKSLMQKLKVFFQLIIKQILIYGQFVKKKKKSGTAFCNIYNKFLRPTNGQRRIVFFFKSSAESMVTKEKRSILKLIDDFAKFKAYQINYSKYKFDYMVDLGQMIIRKNNNADFNIVNGEYIVQDTPQFEKMIKNFDNFQTLKFSDVELHMSLYSPIILKEYVLEVIDFRKLRDLRLSQGWQEIQNLENTYIYTKNNSLGVYNVQQQEDEGGWLVTIQTLIADCPQEIVNEETEIFDRLLFQFLTGINKNMHSKKKLFDFVKSDTNIMDNFEAKALYDQKCSK